MKEDKIEKLNESEKKEGEISRIDKIKYFTKKHKKKIFFGVGLAVATGVTIFFVKNPQQGKMIVLKIKDKFSKGHTRVIDVTRMSDDVLSSLIEEVEQKITSKDQYIEETYSAKRIGEIIGSSPQQVNKMLFQLGYLEGEPGNWSLTPKGERTALIKADDNGYGGYAKQIWLWFEWPKGIISELKSYKKQL